MPDHRQRFLARITEERHPIRDEAPPPQGDDTTAVLRLYDPIDSWGGDWGISAKEFVGVLDDLPDTTSQIRLLINSLGGDVFDALAIVNALRSHDATVTAVVEGIAASAASFIACAADELVMAPNSELMIHDSWGLCVGNAGDMRKLADQLDHCSDNIASIYAAKAGGDTATWRAAMVEETWYSAEEAVTAGLADSVGATPADPTAKDRFDLTIFNFSGRREAPGPQASAIPPSPGPPKGQKGGSMPELTPEHLDLLGLTEDASAEDIQAKLTELTATPEPPDPANALPEGHVAVPEARLRDLEEGARLGTEAANKLRLQERKEFLDSVRAKYAPANRAAWEKEYDRDPEGTRNHFASAPDILPLQPLGSGGSVDIDVDEANYRALFGEEVKA